jgi:hypothetical protein
MNLVGRYHDNIPTILNSLSTAPSPQPMDISSIMNKLQEKLLHVHTQSFENHCVKLRKSPSIVESMKHFQYIVRKSLQHSRPVNDSFPNPLPLGPRPFQPEFMNLVRLYTYLLTSWPTAGEDITPRAIFFFETFQPEFMNLVGHYHDDDGINPIASPPTPLLPLGPRHQNILKNYIAEEPHLLSNQTSTSSISCIRDLCFLLIT